MLDERIEEVLLQKNWYNIDHSCNVRQHCVNIGLWNLCSSGIERKDMDLRKNPWKCMIPHTSMKPNA